MGQGGPGSNFVIHLILSGAQNYGDSNHKSGTFRNFLLIKLFGPKLGVLGAQKWAKEGPDRFLSLTQFCRAPEIMGIPIIKIELFGNFY